MRRRLTQGRISPRAGRGSFPPPRHRTARGDRPPNNRSSSEAAMIELNDVVYCRLGTTDLAGAEWYAVNILGLEIPERRKRATYFKSDHRAHTLCYFEGDPED